jgi:2-polyprenyl-3-methyl-5-hydroxy-6-metoxy-1,4-benzoquinol methylase
MMNCRHCHAPLKHVFLDLGTAPPSNAYLTATQLQAPEPWYPLRLLVCERCWLVQTEDYVQREQLFTDHYAYFSSISSSWLAHAQRYVETMQSRFALNETSLVVEIAANDGYLLRFVRDAGIPCYGIEPTASTAAAAKAQHLEIIERFFDVSLADELARAGRQADLMIANNVLAHVPKINQFVQGFQRLLKPSGVATFEFPHLLQFYQNNQFDTAYHEHYFYLSMIAVEHIMNEADLQIFDVEQWPTHGGSLRIFVQRRDTGRHPVTDAVDQLRYLEVATGMMTLDWYRHFQPKVENIKHQLLRFLLESKQRGQRIGAYGAAAKGNTLFNFAGVRADLVPYVCDAAPSKQGHYLPGSRIPIYAPEHLRQDRPDWILLLPWNLQDELTQQLADAKTWGGRFVTAIPSLQY